MGAAASRVRAARGGGAPRLGLVTVGQLAEGHTGDDAGAREQLAPYGQSWFNKKAAGERHGVEVEQVDLPHETSTALTLTLTLTLNLNLALTLTLTLTLTPNLSTCTCASHTRTHRPSG